MFLDILQCTEQPHITKKLLTPNFNSVKIEKTYIIWLYSPYKSKNHLGAPVDTFLSPEILLPRLLPQNHTPAPPSNGNQLFLSKFRRKLQREKQGLVRTTRPKMTEDLTSSRPWSSLYAHCNTSAKWHTHGHHDSSESDHKRSKSGQWPNSWKSLPLLQNSWKNPPTH